MRRFACLAALSAAAAVMAVPHSASACGGCFSPPTENTVVTAHRMALSVSQDQTVLWDQIQYTGDPADFSWVLPVKPGAQIAIASDALFDVLEAATGMAVAEPQVFCGGDGFYGGDYGDYEGGHSSGFGCGASEDMMGAPSDAYGSGATGGGGDLPPPPPDVEVLSEGSVGPYETVTLSTDVPGALDDWMNEHGYSVPAEIQPVIDAYVAEGYDFIALRLAPGQGVGAMKPVRITMPGGTFSLPLRMVAAGTGANTAMTLFMIGEGRYQPANFPTKPVPTEELVWDFADSSSNYAQLRLDTMAEQDGRTWITTYARRGSIFKPVEDNLVPNMPPNVAYNVNGSTYETIGQAVVRQGLANGEVDDLSCEYAFQSFADSMDKIVNNCDADGICAPLEPGQIPADEFRCGSFDDLAVALTGLHPNDVWLSRLEANLPRAALDQDLVLEASSLQITKENRVVAPEHDNHPCDQQASIAPMSKSKQRRLPGGPALPTLLLAGLFWAHRRRRAS